MAQVSDTTEVAMKNNCWLPKKTTNMKTGQSRIKQGIFSLVQ